MINDWGLDYTAYINFYQEAAECVWIYQKAGNINNNKILITTITIIKKIII